MAKRQIVHINRLKRAYNLESWTPQPKRKPEKSPPKRTKKKKKPKAKMKKANRKMARLL